MQSPSNEIGSNAKIVRPLLQLQISELLVYLDRHQITHSSSRTQQSQRQQNFVLGHRRDLQITYNAFPPNVQSRALLAAEAEHHVIHVTLIGPSTYVGLHLTFCNVVVVDDALISVLISGFIYTVLKAYYCTENIH